LPLEVQHELLRFSRLDTTQLLSDPSQQLAYGYVAGNALAWNDQMGLGLWSSTKEKAGKVYRGAKKAVRSLKNGIKKAGRNLKRRAKKTAKFVATKVFGVTEKGEWIFPEGGSQNLNDYGQVMTNGILGKLEGEGEFRSKVELSKIPGYYNPSQGFIRDVWQAFKQKINGSNDELAKGFSDGLAGVDHPMEIIAHSQGTLTVKNAAIHGGGVPTGSTLDLRSPAASKLGANKAESAINGTLIYDQPWGDIANVISPSLNPLKLATGFADLLCNLCIHKGNGLP